MYYANLSDVKVGWEKSYMLQIWVKTPEVPMYSNWSAVIVAPENHPVMLE